MPYEVSCDLIKSHKTGLEAMLVGFRKRLRDILEGRVTRFIQRNRSLGAVEVDEYVVGVTEPYRFTRALESLRWEVESRIRQAESTIARFAARIAAWESKPIRTVEEEVRKELEAKAARKADRDAARAVRAAKKAATAAKQAALAARRQAVVSGFVGALRALADQPASPDRDQAARKVWADVTGHKKYPWLWIHELLKQGAEAPTLALGLIRRDPSGRVTW